MSRFQPLSAGTKSVMLVDCTLREGKQSIKKNLSSKEIILVAEKVLSLGVDQLEVGHAAISAQEVNMLRQIRRISPYISLMTHARAKRQDILMASEARVDWVGIFISTNQYARHRIRDFSVQKVIDQVAENVALAKANGLKVRFTIEDSSRTDMALMLQLFEVAVNLGADRICFADTLGILEPKEVGAVVRDLTEKFSPVPLEVHLHNDRGLAMANTLEAIDSGAQWISSSINGIGERAGITDTCLLLANLHYKNIRPLLPSSNLREVSQIVGQQMGSMVDEHRPVIGGKAFQHLAALHVKAMKRDPNTYNWIEPELLGHKTNFPERLPLICDNLIASSID